MQTIKDIQAKVESATKLSEIAHNAAKILPPQSELRSILFDRAMDANIAALEALLTGGTK